MTFTTVNLRAQLTGVLNIPDDYDMLNALAAAYAGALGDASAQALVVQYAAAEVARRQAIDAQSPGVDGPWRAKHGGQ